MDESIKREDFRRKYVPTEVSLAINLAHIDMKKIPSYSKSGKMTVYLKLIPARHGNKEYIIQQQPSEEEAANGDMPRFVGHGYLPSLNKIKKRRKRKRKNQNE